MPLRALIVDDDPGMCSIVTRMLERSGYVTATCGDAETALVRLDLGESYDVLISDYMLPGMSGFELVRRVRSSLRMKPMRIVMISAHNAYANYKMEERALAAGADVFLNKPFTPDHLRHAARTPRTTGAPPPQR